MVEESEVTLAQIYAEVFFVEPKDAERTASNFNKHAVALKRRRLTRVRFSDFTISTLAKVLAYLDADGFTQIF